MILAPLEQAGEYIDLHPGFVRAFEFLQQENIDTLSPGRYDLAGDTLFAIVSRDSGKTRQQARLEAHRKYIDIQYVIAGVEEMGWRPTAECTQIATPYDIEKDIMFFNDVPKTWTIVPPGSFVIFFPKDAHAPMVGTGEIHKIVCKVLEAQ
ncbi:DUF386 domain-containing protein [candidate division KSB1 bacterium]|nr:YhcH/YjgK/YiaL family protein [candidate division KSB1 bacterium]RQW05251.1 MAG: DUF386 domain-containing protein [candidate division KSB1 bacterium]